MLITHRQQMPDRTAPALMESCPVMGLDYDTIRDAADDVIAEAAALMLENDERVLSFIKLVQWDREEALIAAITAGDATRIGTELLQRISEIAQECAEEEWTK